MQKYTLSNTILLTGEVQETGWIDITLPDAGSEQEEPTDSEPLEQELEFDLKDVDHEELLMDKFDDEGIVSSIQLYASPGNTCACPNLYS